MFQPFVKVNFLSEIITNALIKKSCKLQDFFINKEEVLWKNASFLIGAFQT